MVDEPNINDDVDIIPVKNMTEKLLNMGEKGGINEVDGEDGDDGNLDVDVDHDN